MASPTPQQLRAEIDADPAALGYAALVAAKNDAGLAAALNAVRAGAAFSVNRGPIVPSYEIINATDPAEWAALTAGEKQRYQTLTGAGNIDLTNPNLRASFTTMFAAGTATRTALVALLTRQGSRAEVLWGTGTTISANDVAAAFGRF